MNTALTVRQPWASLIVSGVKDVENRSWRTRHRGPLIIHAGRLDRSVPQHVWSLADELGIELPTGVLLGEVDLFDVIEDSPSVWAMPGLCHWLIRDARPIEPVPAKGRLGLWEVHV